MNALLTLLLLLPQSPDGLARGRRLLESGDYPAAAEALREAAEAHADDPQAWALLGQALHAQEDWDGALEVYDRLRAFPKAKPRACYNAACVYTRLHDPDAAIDLLREAIGSGFFDRLQLAHDPELEDLRDDPRFAKLLPPYHEGSSAFVEEPRVLHELYGEAPGDQFGWVARAMGDLDADGVTDFAATAPSHAIDGAAYCGRVYVYSGKTGATRFTLDGRPGQGLGNSVAGRVDVDGDGTQDILTGGPGYGSTPGMLLVASGRDGRVLHELTAGEGGDQFGVKVCGIEDLDGDGCADIAVGAMKSDAAGTDAGRVYMYSGKTGKLLFTIEGDAPGDQLGSAIDATHSGGHRLLLVGAMTATGGGRAIAYRCSAEGAERAFDIEPDDTSSNLGQYFVSILGDVDGDSIPDVYASDWNNAASGASTGRVFVHSGKDGERLLTVTGHAPGEGFGTSPAVCGDVNGDGRADLVVGAWQHASVASSAGAVYLHSGADGSLLQRWASTQAGDTLGFDAVGLGDVDGDGAVDFLLTSAWSAARGPKTGRVFVVAGPRFDPASER